jgi:general secretion pathway protein G
MESRREEEGGFTLIELLIVIIVLGILAAIVVFAVGSTRKDSVSSSCKTNYKQVELSAEAVNTKVGSYPLTANVWTAATNTPVPDGTNELVANNTSVPGNGALMKTYPTSADYRISYAYAAGATSPTIQVLSKTGAVVPAAGGTGTSADCSAL